MKCSVYKCKDKVLCKKFCNRHYLRYQRYGDVRYTKLIKGDSKRRFWSKVKKTRSCWIWRGTVRNSKGYGAFSEGSKTLAAHRYSYELNKGKIPKYMQIDHLCMNKLCVNPKHLEVVTNKENQYRAHYKRGKWPIETREPKVIKCVWCNKTFKSIMYERAKYCSNSCRSKAARNKKLFTNLIS